MARSVGRRNVVRELLATVPFLGPALLLATRGPAPGVAEIAVGAAAAAAVVLSLLPFRSARAGALPILVAAAIGAAALAPDGFVEAGLAGATGVGLLGWLAVRSDGPAGLARRATAVAVPGLATLAAWEVGAATPGLSAGPGAVALLLVAALALAGIAVTAAPAPVEPPAASS